MKCHHLILTTTLWGGYDQSPHFTTEETEDQGVCVNLPSTSTAHRQQRWDLNTGLSDSKLLMVAVFWCSTKSETAIWDVWDFVMENRALGRKEAFKIFMSRFLGGTCISHFEHIPIPRLAFSWSVFAFWKGYLDLQQKSPEFFKVKKFKRNLKRLGKIEPRVRSLFLRKIYIYDKLYF